MECVTLQAKKPTRLPWQMLGLRFALGGRFTRSPLRKKRFKYRFVFNDEYGMYMNCKGYNARCVSEWLLDAVIKVRNEGW